MSIPHVVYSTGRPPYPRQRTPPESRVCVAVVGPGNFPSPKGWPWLWKTLDRVCYEFHDPIILVEGTNWWDKDNACAKLVMNWASHYWYTLNIYYCEEKRGPRSRLIEKRRQSLLKATDYLVAFWDEVCPWVEGTIEEARELGVKRKVFTY